MRYLLPITLMLAGLIIPVATAEAAPPPYCQPGYFPQHDVAGIYESPYMRLMVYPCGGISVAWENAYGGHAAAYVGNGRLNGDGVMALGTRVDQMSGTYLDDSLFLGIKASTPGYVELVTYGPSPDIYNMPVRAVYRLRKIN
jgi:hypothetical protein